MKCPICGAPMGESFQFCTSCGSALPEKDNGSVPPSAPSAPGSGPGTTEKDLAGIPLSLRKIWDQPVEDSPNPKPVDPENQPVSEKTQPMAIPRPARADPESTRRFERPVPTARPQPGHAGPSPTPAPERQQRRSPAQSGRPAETKQAAGRDDRPSLTLRILLLLCALLLMAVIVILLREMTRDKTTTPESQAAPITVQAEENEIYQEARDAILVDEDGVFLGN